MSTPDKPEEGVEVLQAPARLPLWRAVGTFLFGAAISGGMVDGFAGYVLLDEQAGLLRRVLKTGSVGDGPFLGGAVTMILWFVALIIGVSAGVATLRSNATSADSGNCQHTGIWAGAGYGLALAVLAIHLGYWSLYQARSQLIAAEVRAQGLKRELHWAKEKGTISSDSPGR